MTDKVQKIREEVEKLKDELNSPDASSYTEAYIIGATHTINSVLDIIDSLEEESVSEELEEASRHYALNNTPWDDCADEMQESFKAGANWQKEQMMAKAIDGEVGYWNQRGLSVLMELPRELEEDDKCKVIIIKED